jgi:2-polyprenyl-3-methyl-5-hydroxy-6-metoxy-1,4-benzoquinol methylase
VVGIDPAAGSIATAKAHAEAAGLDIEYRQAAGEALPFEDGSFDLVYCCDVIEHVADPGRLVAESARVLRPGGTYLFDTITCSPVRGLRPVRARLLLTVNAPKPRSSTRSPRDSAATTSSRMASTICSASR